MSDERVAQLLRSADSLVAIEAAAGCGKTHQGAEYARDWARAGQPGRLLILTHTHAACDVFLNRVRGVGSKIEVSTIDGLIVQVARAYHNSLGLPPDPARWANQNPVDGYDQLADRVSAFVARHPLIADAVARRYSTIICDEHQDCTESRHRIIMAIHNQGAKLRLFADPMQRIYGGKSNNDVLRDTARWEEVRNRGSSDLLDTPHRWATAGVGDLGEWIVGARANLQAGNKIDLTAELPAELEVIIASDVARTRTQFQVNNRVRIDAVKNSRSPLMVLATTNDCGSALRAFWNRALPIWEGYQRPSLTSLIEAIEIGEGDATAVGSAIVDFLQATGVGFGDASHADRFRRELEENCRTNPRGPKPKNIHSLARIICDAPNHIGAAHALRTFRQLAKANAAGFDNVKIDQSIEFAEATRLDSFENCEAAHAELARRRTHIRRPLPEKCISTIHKAKGLETDHVMLVVNKLSDTSGTLYSRNRLYVGLSRAKRSLTIVVPDVVETPILKIR